MVDGVKDFLEIVDDLDTNKHYFEDPTITFENSILTGCYVDMNLEQFTKFCQYESLYLNMALI